MKMFIILENYLMKYLVVKISFHSLLLEQQAGFESKDLTRASPIYLLWYAKNKTKLKYRQLFKEKDSGLKERLVMLHLPSGDDAVY